MNSLSRRSLLGALAGAPASLAWPSAAAGAGPEPELEQHDLALPGDPKLARRCLLLVPRGAKGPLRLLVLCHGLGETSHELAGVRAWADRYGLRRAYERLRAPPVVRAYPRQRYLSDEHARRLNEALAQRPFAGYAVACPFTPNVYKAASTARALERYAHWVADVLVPELRGRLAIEGSRDALGIDGVSLGGYVSLEVFLRRPEVFGAVGTVQGAFGVRLAEAYAVRLRQALAKHGARQVRVATSSGDPYRAAAQRLSQRLEEASIDVRFSLTPGPHDQIWLREVGSLELLHDYDRLLAKGAAS